MNLRLQDDDEDKEKNDLDDEDEKEDNYDGGGDGDKQLKKSPCFNDVFDNDDRKTFLYDIPTFLAHSDFLSPMLQPRRLENVCLSNMALQSNNKKGSHLLKHLTTLWAIGLGEISDFKIKNPPLGFGQEI